ncbi:MAG TPA: hypothetical protein VGL53_08815 [Bryobacteraceae bacterium]|jgi:hypothetical protein
MSIVVSHETRRVAAAKPRRQEPEKSPEKPLAQRPPDPDLGDVLMDLFGEALSHWCPRSVAVLAAANSKLAGFDVNFWYLDEPGNRYIRKCSLELHCTDLTGQHVDVERVKLVHAPLVFEHLAGCELLDDALALIAPGGAFSVVVEMPEEFEAKVSRGHAPSIVKRRTQFSVANPILMRETLDKHGLRLTHQAKRELKSGRKLWMGIFAK